MARRWRPGVVRCCGSNPVRLFRDATRAGGARCRSDGCVGSRRADCDDNNHAITPAATSTPAELTRQVQTLTDIE